MDGAHAGDFRVTHFIERVRPQSVLSKVTLSISWVRRNLIHPRTGKTVSRSSTTSKGGDIGLSRSDNKALYDVRGHVFRRLLRKLPLQPARTQIAEFFKSAAEWLEALYQANERSEVFPQRAFAKMLAKHFVFQCQCSSRRSFRGDRVYARLKFNTAYSPRLTETLGLTAKALLKCDHSRTLKPAYISGRPYELSTRIL
jgi:hypothetical protein